MVTPTSSQAKIRDLDKLDLLVIAPAGCGKTEALALRVAGLVERGLITHPHKVLVTTFSNRARDNVRDRLRDYMSTGMMRDRVTVSNFHGLSARIFRAHASVVGLDPNMTIPESDWVGDQCRSRKLTFNDSAVVQNLISSLKRDALSDAEVMDGLEVIGNDVAIEIEKLRLAEERLTYDDLPRIAELILQHDDVAALYRTHFAAVIVDEFQDLTPQQLRIVNRIGLQRTTFAGDLAQGIYGFAGAQPDAINAAVRAECSQVVEFAESHRSSPAVLAVVNALAHRTGGTALTSADPESWPDGGLAGWGAFDSTKAEADWALRFATFVGRRAPSHRIGIISRTASRRRFVDAAFEASDVTHYRWDDGILDTDTARIVRSVLARLDPAEFAAASNPLAFLRDTADVDGLQDPSGREALVDSLAWVCDLFQNGVSAPQIRSRIKIGDSTTLLSAPGAHLLTGHVGKGQQFDWVIVVGAEEGCIPDFRAKTTASLAEEARIFSVMLSRARHGAVVLWSQKVEVASGATWAKSKSRFLADFEGVASVRNASDTVEWLKNASWSDISSR